MRVAVVGGGLAGLSAALELVDGGHQVTLHEARPTLGGAVQTLPRREGDPEPPPGGQRLVGSFVWLRSAQAGWWDSAVSHGDAVAAGELLGRVRNLWGDVLEEVAAPQAGVILFVTTSPAVGDDGLLLGLGAELDDLG